MLKRIISLLLVLVMVISMLPARAVAAGYQTALDRAADFGAVLEEILEQSVETEATSAPEETIQQIVPEALPELEPEIILMDTEGDYTYTVSSENTATITGYSGTDTELVIPDTLGGYPVTGIGYNAFRNCDTLTQVTIPASVSEASGNYWFEDCDNLTLIILEDGLQKIPNRAFANLKTNFTIELPETLTVIGEGAFYGCSGLTQVTLPSALEKIDGSGFRDCKSLESILIPDTVTEIWGWAFCNCDALTEISIPAGVTVPGDGNWFIDCDNLTSITLAEGMTEIPSRAFQNLKTAFTISIPDTVTVIRDNVFRDCTALAEVSLPTGLVNIGYNAFRNCDALTQVTIPASVSELSGDYWFEDCDNLTAITLEEGMTVIPDSAFRNLKTDFTISIPDTVTRIQNNAFCGCTGLTRIDLPDGIAIIDYNAFYDCTALAEVALPTGLTHLGDRVFYNCDALTEMELSIGADCVLGSGIFEKCDQLSEIRLGAGIQMIPDGMFRNTTANFTVIIPDTVTRIGNEAFLGCTGLTQVQIPTSVTQIGNHAYYGCSALTEVVIPDSVTIMGSYAFADCKALHQVTLSKNWTEVTQYSSGTWGDPVYGGPFCNCTALTSVTVPDGAQSVAHYAFQGCTALTDVQIPDSVTVIGGHSFRGCTSLTGIEFPKALIEISPHAFSGCVGLTEVEIPDTVEILGGCAFDGCVNLTQVKLPLNWKTVSAPRMTIIWYNPVYDDGPFSNCTGLKELTVPEGMIRLPDYAFQNSPALVDIRLPDSLTEIGKQALEGCTALKQLQVSDTVTTVGNNAFAKCEELVVSCTMDSYILEYALNNDIQVNITDWTRPESDILEMDNTYYNTNSSDVNASGYIDLVVHYELKPEQVEKLSDMKLKVLLQSKLVLIENSMRLNGEVPSGYTYQDNVLTVPVTESNGTLRFSVNPERAAQLFSRAEFVYTKDGTTDSDIIDCINSDMPVLTLVTNATVNTADIRVSGIAPAEAVLTFFIDDVEAGTTTASKAGNYSAELTIPNPEEGKTYAVKAVAKAGEDTVEKTMSVTYDLASPVLEELLLYYSGHETGRYENYIVDLTDPHAGYTVITFNPTHDYIFRVKMSHPEQISCLYVTSTRNGQTKYIEAKYDEKTGYFVTKDKFDNDVWNYVPGEIGVIYDRTYPELDRSDLEGAAAALIEDTAKHGDVSQIDVSVAENTEEDYVVNAVMPNGEEVTYEYHTFTQSELFDYLRTEGIITDSDLNRVRPKGFEIEDLLLEWFEYRVMDDEEYYTTSNTNGTFYLNPLDDPSSEEDVFAIWAMKGSLTTIIDMAMNPDNAELFGNGVGSMYLDGFDAIYRYGDRMWHLNMDKKDASPEKLAQIEETEELLTFVLMSRLILAAAELSITALCPPAGLAVAVVSFLLSDLLDSLEEEGSWVEGYENSIIGTIMNWHSLLHEALVLFAVQNLLKWIIDPSGYVYEAVTTNRLPGVTATVYFQDPESGQAVLWDAAEYDQINPIITGPDGSYAWDVPEGLWQVKYELEGYETVSSEWMPVPPPQTDVNIGMVSYEVPETKWIDVYHDSVEIEFSKYMIPDTVDEITLTDSRGNAIAYTLEYSTDETAADGTVYAREFTLEFDSSFLNRGESCFITIPGGVQSYAGINAEAETLTRVCAEEIVISAPSSVTIPYGEQAVISVSVSAEDFENIEVVSMFAERAAVDAIEKTDLGWDVTISGQLPGRTAILISIPGIGVSKYVELVIDASDSAHTHDYTCEITTAATCTEEGSLTYTCTICGESYVEMIPALGHSFGDWTVILEPTTTAEGLEERSCNRCGYTEERSISKLENPFTDVTPSDYYYDPVLWALGEGITDGVTETEFAPEDTCKRSQVVTFLWRAAGEPKAASRNNPFVDVKSSDYFYEAVLWAVEKGITDGMDETHFEPDGVCNRSQVVTFLYRAFGEPPVGSASNPFTDVPANKWYATPVLWAVKEGITDGVTETSFAPEKPCTRAQVVTFLYRAYN